LAVDSVEYDGSRICAAAGGLALTVFEMSDMVCVVLVREAWL
jgi:hypothetical protein